MAIINPPMWMQQGTYSARQDRLPLLGWLAGRGVAERSHFAVTQTATPSMAVNVGGGYAYIPGDDQAYQGVYTVINDGTVSIPVTPADTTFPRIDLVVVRVYDAFVAGSQNLGTIEIIPGTPNTNPQPPTRPNSAIEIARINVAANATGISNTVINLTNKMIARLRGSMVNFPEVVANTSSFAVPGPRLAGEEFFTSDRRAMYMFDGTKYVQTGGDTGWQTLTLNNSWRAYNASYIPRYRVKNGFVTVTGLIARSAAPAAEQVMATLPPSAAPDIPNTQMIISARANNTAEASLGVWPNGQIKYKNGAWQTWISLDDIPTYPIASL